MRQGVDASPVADSLVRQKAARGRREGTKTRPPGLERALRQAGAKQLRHYPAGPALRLPEPGRGASGRRPSAPPGAWPAVANRSRALAVVRGDGCGLDPAVFIGEARVFPRRGQDGSKAASFIYASRPAWPKSRPGHGQPQRQRPVGRPPE